MSSEIVLWNPRQPVKIPAEVKSPTEIAPYIRQLSPREVKQVVQSYENCNYEAGAYLLWTKTMAGLKKQLASLGMDFIGEMLDRSDIDRSTAPDHVLTDYDAVRLAEELGLFTPTESMRLHHVMEMIVHFSQPVGGDEVDDDREMNREEAMLCLRMCVQTVLGQEKLEAPLEFAEFRRRLEEETLAQTDPEIGVLQASPYFFQRTVLRVLLALLKTAHAAQLENAIANAGNIIPLLWPNFQRPDRWTVGRAYAEVFSEGRTTVAAGLSRVLLKVKGFDYVPEDLRSKAFISAAKKLKSTHFAFQNFYNEPFAIENLRLLGSVIPDPALAECVSAILCVRLGNYYGLSWDAQSAAKELLARLGPLRWKYYLEECLPSDEDILYKLKEQRIAARWPAIVTENALPDIIFDTSYARELVKAGKEKNAPKIALVASKLLSQFKSGQT